MPCVVVEEELRRQNVRPPLPSPPLSPSYFCSCFVNSCRLTPPPPPPYQSSTIDFALCLGATAEEQFASRTRKPKPPPAAAAGGGGPSSTNTSAAVAAGDEKPLEKKDEIVANVIWRFLDLRGCVSLFLLMRLSGPRTLIVCFRALGTDSCTRTICTARSPKRCTQGSNRPGSTTSFKSRSSSRSNSRGRACCTAICGAARAGVEGRTSGTRRRRGACCLS